MASSTNGTSTLGADESIDLGGKSSLQQNLSEEEMDKQKLMQEYREELGKIQEDIATLRLVLNDKLKRENELKTLLGVSFVDEIKQDFTEGLNQIKSTVAFQKTAQTFNELGSTIAQNETYQKTATGFKSATETIGSSVKPAFTTFGNTMKNSFSNLGSLRNVSVFKSFEGFGSAFGGNKMKNSQSEYVVDNNDQDGQMSSSKTMTNGFSDKADTIPEEKN